jgi:hypothetical protein
LRLASFHAPFGSGVRVTVAEGAGRGLRSARHLEAAVQVLQVGADRALGQAEPPGDLAVGVAGGEQAQQLPVPGREPRQRVPASFGVEVSLVQVRAQQGEQGGQ